MADVDAPSTVSKMPLLIMGSIVLLAIVVTVALVANRGPESYAPGSPEATLQRFIQAGIDQDETELLGQLSASNRQQCERSIDRGEFDYDWGNDGLRAELVEMTVTGNTAVARVEIHHGDSNDPFNSSSWSFEERFRLTREDGVWVIDGAPWPYPLAECSGAFR